MIISATHTKAILELRKNPPQQRLTVQIRNTSIISPTTQYDPYKKEIKGYQNGNLVRKGRLDDRFFREPNLIQLLSSWITIEPGDVILTGTPGRIGERFFISKDTVYRCEIEGLGSLENSFSLINQS